MYTNKDILYYKQRYQDTISRISNINKVALIKLPMFYIFQKQCLFPESSKSKGDEVTGKLHL